MPKGSEPRDYYATLKVKEQKAKQTFASKSASSEEKDRAISEYLSFRERGQKGRPKTVSQRKRNLDATSFGGLDYQMRKKAEKVKSGRAAFMPVKKTIRPVVSAKKGAK